MSVIGIDFGNSTMVVGAARHRGIDIIANEASKRETPTLVGFKDKRRYLGEQAATQRIGNLQNTISSIKRLVGKKWDQEDVQKEIKSLPFKVEKVGENNIGISILYNGERQVFSPEQILAIILTNMKIIVENDSHTAVKDVVISIPLYFTDAQRRSVAAAAKIAGLNCLRLVTEPLAVATTWGIYKKDLENGTKVLFVDFGESAITATVCQFNGTAQKGEVKILGSAFDQHLGGRDFDNGLVNHFVKEIQAKHKIDVSENPKAMFRLAQSCEKCKNILTSNPIAAMNVESIMNDIDVGFTISRQDFEEINKENVERVVNVVLAAISASGVNPSELRAVELVGGASRIPVVQHRIKDVTGHETSHTMNKTEAVAKGCALVCAILSPQFNVQRDYRLKGYNPYTMEVQWVIHGRDGNTSTESFTVNRGVGTPALVSKVFSNAASVVTTVRYSDPSELLPGSDLLIGQFTIPAIPLDASGEPQKVKLSLKIDDNGLIVLDLAQASEVYYEDDPSPPAPSPSPSPAPAAENEKPKEENGDKMDTEEPNNAAAEEKKEEAGKKKKVKKTNVSVNVVYHNGLPEDQLRSLNSIEVNMRAQDQTAILTEERKNSLESYIYDMRNKIQFEGCELYEFSTASERETFSQKLEETETWLYDDGFDSTKEIYELKLSDLKVLGDPIELRKVESDARPAAIQNLEAALADFEAKALSADEKYSHIDQADKNKIVEKVNEIRGWLNHVMEKQNAVAVYLPPVVLSHEIQSKVSDIDRLATPILNRPKPKPKVEPKPAEQTKPAEQPKPEEQPKPAEQPTPENTPPPSESSSSNSGPEIMEVD